MLLPRNVKEAADSAIRGQAGFINILFGFCSNANKGGGAWLGGGGFRGRGMGR